MQSHKEPEPIELSSVSLSFGGFAELVEFGSERFCKTRELLIASNPPMTRVTDIAYHWGFDHLSQFAINYQAFYGEKPSQTLSRHTT